MKDKLRELAERWRRHSQNGGAIEYIQCANELRSILDAEGDGGAVVWQYRIIDDEEGPSPYWHDMTREQFEMSRAAAKPRYELRHLYTHPARSGVVSDEDVSVVAKMIADRVGNGMREKYEELAKHIAEHFAKGERHER